MTASQLKPGQKLRIAGIEMEFSYFHNQHPVFIHFVDKKYTKNTPLNELK